MSEEGSERGARPSAGSSAASLTNPSETGASGSSETFFGGLTWQKTLGVAAAMGLFALLGALGLRESPSRRVTSLVATSQVVLLLAVLVVFIVGRRLASGQRRTHAMSGLLVARLERIQYAATLVIFAMAFPTIYLLDVTGPADGILALALLFFTIHAPRPWRVTAAVLVIGSHTALEAALALGWLPEHPFVQIMPGRAAQWSNVASTVALYGLAIAIGRVYRGHTSRHLDELAEAGREVAARNVLLREAKLDLDRAAFAVGERGRFTEQRLGSFVLGPLLGFGGMGEVYEATHIDTGDRAAVKLLRPPTGSEATDAFRRFEREAAIVGKLESPHIVRLLEVGGMEAAFPYMAMERLEGDGLHKLLETEGRLAPRRVATMVSEIAAGLMAAKKHDVVHRDIKPSNLFLAKTPEGERWKILDFGLGRMTGDSATLTGGGLVGTLGYIAPEQMLGDGNVSHRTDEHALAIVAYRALTGRHAFVERDAAQVMREVATQLPPRPSELVSTLPPLVDDVLRIALAKDPRDRFEDAAELARLFEGAIEEKLDATVVAALRARARRLSGSRDWATSQKSRQPSRQRRGAVVTATMSLPAQPAVETNETGTLPAPPPKFEETATKPRPAEAGATSTTPSISSSTDTSTPDGKVSLVAPPEELVRSLWFAPARAVVASLIIATIYSYGQIPFHPQREMRPFGFVSFTLLLLELLAIGWLSKDKTERGLRRSYVLIGVAFATFSLLIYFFGPLGDTASFVTLLLVLVGSGVTQRRVILYTLAVAVPHLTMHLLITFGLLQDRGYYALTAGSYGRLLNFGQIVVLYGLAFVLAIMFQRETRRTVIRLSQTFRQNAEREALLRDARLELERAMGVGQPGRFTGTRMGSFLLGVVLGRGGMGEVYEATDTRTREPAAVKLLSRSRSFREDSSDESPIARFEREGKAILALGNDNPHVVRVLEIGSDPSALPYIAMERLSGHDLSAILQRRLFLSEEEVAEMITQISGALEIAHARGIVHGDITPRNLFLTDDGTWKLLDFGVASLGSAREDRRAGRPMGTPGYLAPEQLEEDVEVDHRADIHALGVVAYRALTGRPAFAGRDAAAILYRVLSELPVRPSAQRAELSRLVDDVLLIALAKAPHDRFDQVATFARAFSLAKERARDERVTRRAERLAKRLDWAAKT